MTKREEKRIQALRDEASRIVSQNEDCRAKVKANLAQLRAMADLIKAKSAQVPDEVQKELADNAE